LFFLFFHKKGHFEISRSMSIKLWVNCWKMGGVLSLVYIVGCVSISDLGCYGLGGFVPNINLSLFMR